MMSLVLMMARPVLTRRVLLATVESGNKILILDNSLSMGYREERGERYDLAKRAAKEVIGRPEGAGYASSQLRSLPGRPR